MRIRPARFGIVAAYATTASTGGGGSTTTLDPSNLGTGLSLSGGNLILTPSTGNYASTRSIASHTTGKFYYEATVTAANGVGADMVLGIMNSSSTINNYLGADNNSIGAFGGPGSWLFNNVNEGGSFAVGYGSLNDVAGIAVDLGAQLIWMRNSGTPSSWNAGGTANPATGVGGASFTALTGTYYAAFCLKTGNQFTANFGGTAYAASAPAGFGNW